MTKAESSHLASQKLIDQLDQERLPQHIAIIMDGNGRWAQKRFLPRVAGHRAGIKSVEAAVTICRKIGIRALTLYSFSIENWNRPKAEVDTLMQLLEEYIHKELARMKRENIRCNVIGRLEDLPVSVQKAVEKVIRETRDNEAMVLTLALSYGSRTEITQAVKGICQDLLKGNIALEEIDEDLFGQYLNTSGLPEPDLLIRTSGEFRISNFLLWQIAYTELYFTRKLWPDFRENDLLLALLDYQKRERRFGLTGQQLASREIR